jgi:hypothetical protein
MTTQRKKPIYALLLLTLPTVVLSSVTLILMNWPIATHVEVDLTVNRVTFVTGGSDLTTILNSVVIQALTIEQFDKIVLSPKQMKVADPAQYRLLEDSYPNIAWKSLIISSPLGITGIDETLHPSINFESVKSNGHIMGVLDRVRIQPGSEITLEVSGDRTISLTIKINHQASFAIASFRKPFQLMTKYCHISGLNSMPFSADVLTYRVQLVEHHPHVEITGTPQSLVLILMVSPEENANLFSKEGIPITSLDFTRQSETSNPVTTLVQNGELHYSDYPESRKVVLKASDYVRIERLEKFRIEGISMEPKHKGIRMRLNGVAGCIRNGSLDFLTDRRMTMFDVLWQSRSLAILFYIVSWVFPTTIGGYKLYREFSR